MLAVLNEALREYPPVVIGLPRVAPNGGGIVDGNPVPQGVSGCSWREVTRLLICVYQPTDYRVRVPMGY